VSRPVLSIVGWSGAGKTTLIESLLSALKARGLRVGVAKHSSHEHPRHKTGSDTERYETAGAAWTAFETPSGSQWTFPFDNSDYPPCDLVLVEGDKESKRPKIEVANSAPEALMAQSDPNIFAVVGVKELTIPQGVAHVAPGDTEALVELILAWMSARNRPEGTRVEAGVTSRPGSIIASDKGITRHSVPGIALEEPLEIRVAGDPIATTMRTPGHDERLVAGFLWAEGILRSSKQIGALVHCGDAGSEGAGNVMDLRAAPGALFEVERLRTAKRGTLTTSACGVCGRDTIEDLLKVCRPIDSGVALSPALLQSATASLRGHQPLFQATGGTHAAGIFDATGKVLAVFEDVGRHNAVDKAVGELVLRQAMDNEARPGAVLAVSGRASFEIIQKAAMARIPCVVSVSAASSLAIDLAREMGITLASFVRGQDFVLFTHPERISGI
jgi:FdhD protein